MKCKTYYILIFTILFISCGEGYEKIDGKWAWILYSEAGKHVREVNADNITFKILSYPEYAKDKNSVYWRGVEIVNADPKTFEVISENGYSKDKNNVYLDSEIVIFAKPNTFKLIEWPYSKDNERVFNGNLPMEVNKINEFEIIKTNGNKTSTIKSYFIKQNKEYKWLDTLTVNSIIVGEFAEAKTKKEKFIGFKRVK